MARLLILAFFAVANAASASITFTTHLPSPQSFDLFVPSSGSNVVYLATQDALYRSDDGGPFVKRSSHNIVLADPTDADRLYGWSTDGFDRSSDGGLTWQTVARRGNFSPIFTPNDYAIDPRHPATLYISTTSVPAPFSSAGLLRSDDFGATWRQVGGPAQNIAVDPISGQVYGVWIGNLGDPIDTPPTPAFKIVASKRNPNLRYAIGFEKSNSAGTYVSGEMLVTFDGAKSWQKLAMNGIAATRVDDIALDDATGRVFVTAAGGLYVSPYGGPFWQHVDGVPLEGLGGVAIEGDFLYAWSSSGIVRAPLGTVAPFTPLPLPFDAGAVVNMLVADPNSHVLYAASADGILRSADAGQSWELLPESPGSQSHIAVDGAGEVYTVGDHSTGDVLFHYSGGTWKQVSTGLPAVGVLIANPMRRGDLFAVTPNGVFHSNDSARTWLNVPALYPGAGLAFDPTNADTLYAFKTSALLVSLDDGETWTVRDRTPNSVSYAIAPSRSSRMYRVMSAYVAEYPYYFLQRSDDDGATWISVTKPATKTPQYIVSTFAIDPLNEDSVWIVGMSAPTGAPTLWHTIDGGRSWTDEHANFPRWPTAILIDRDGQWMHVVANGVWDARIRGEHNRASGH